MRKYYHLFHYLNVALFGVILLFGKTYDHGLKGDDLHYAAISKELLTSHNPLFLSLTGQPYLNKPPLFFWLNSVMISLFGNNAYGAKFVSVAAGVILLLIIFRIAAKTFDSINAGYGAVIFFLCNYIVFKNTQACRFESLLTLFIILSLAAAYRYLGSKKTFYLVLSGLAAGLAVLTKGAAGGLVFVLVVPYVLIFGDRSNKVKLFTDILIASVVFAAAFGWWYGYAFLKTDVFKVQVMNESVGRLSFVKSGWKNGQPIYEYVKSFAMFNFIMIPFLLIGVYKGLLPKIKHRGVILFFIYFIVYFIIIHFMKTKYDRYLYPIMPMLSIVAGAGLASVVKFEMKRVVMAIYLVFACVMVLYPGSTGVEGYNRLAGLEKIAETNKLTLCADKGYFRNWERKSSLVFYLDSDYEVGECGPGTIHITTKNGECAGTVILRNRKLKACISHPDS